MSALLIIVAGVTGAFGVGLSAMSHTGGQTLLIAGGFLLLHAPVFLAFALILHVEARGGSLLPRRSVLLVTGVMLAGLALFSGDLAIRALAGRALFPMAAPTGGTLLLLGWLALATAGAFAARRQ